MITLAICNNTHSDCKSQITPDLVVKKDDYIIVNDGKKFPFVVGQNEINLGNYPSKKGQFIAINILSGSIALNTKSEQTDYKVDINDDSVSFSKLNNQTNWRFCFKTLIYYNLYQIDSTIEHRYGKNEDPIPQKVYPFILSVKYSYENGSLKSNTEILNKQYRFTGRKALNFDLILIFTFMQTLEPK